LDDHLHCEQSLPSLLRDDLLDVYLTVLDARDDPDGMVVMRVLCDLQQILQRVIVA
jgi:hypothetical protein